MLKTIDRLAQYRDFDWSGWTEWTPLASVSPEDVPAQPGAYVISAGTRIARAAGADDLGILDIGEAGEGVATLRSRLESFRKCAMNRGKTGHMAGWRYAFFHFNRYFPLSNLRVRWSPTSSKDTAYALEGRLLLTYVLRYGELPPLNYKFNWSAFESIGWDVFDDPAVFDPAVLVR
ncbi:hypothetical protein [Vitiosangium sp. GDMCC 1.1324]|uniref:hypothetical protein n=1 Tax=Vitiosangium sp. (strain GDMCC 1.1324) TaxID=2138576 RepID=UPI000D3B96D8|nr:hypothetical protein [Vitiosangium sp. GDMCC 1.1324]PTL80812.1 hypothetical protein DAT35_26080 [Vitiosangium sp. GDMCC 1.1324]